MHARHGHSPSPYPRPGCCAPPRSGELYLADIGVPVVYQRFGLNVPPLFTDATMLRLPTYR